MLDPISIHPLIALNMVGWEQTLAAVGVSKPPILIRELQVGNFVAFIEAQFYKFVSQSLP